ncbi:Exosome complex component RRP40 [Strongyloides ratti]|uniref:Ribosomal RNA-processing protein 40 n=1 Tax=Strongyloides ratti TaxID=34506 RepID=A0A090L8J6_STRRB|nr:Exosome complex component RRP40 [Strongyloides ratti]CEF63800.1 Exosome complex component RRP40 [Strongyloides ratti]
MTKVVLPGDFIEDINNLPSVPVIGRGLKVYKNEIISTQGGVFCSSKDGMYVDVSSKRYQPTVNDLVIGVVINVMVENIKLDICYLENAVLSTLSFEGATKRNKPNIKVGDVVYARVISTSKYLETELACIDKDNFARGLGVLPSGGMVFKVSLKHARRLLCPKCKLLDFIGKEIKYESCIGINGRIWVKADTNQSIKCIVKIIQQSETIPNSKLEEFVSSHVSLMRNYCKEEVMEIK